MPETDDVVDLLSEETELLHQPRGVPVGDLDVLAVRVNPVDQISRSRPGAPFERKVIDL